MTMESEQTLRCERLVTSAGLIENAVLTIRGSTISDIAYSDIAYGDIAHRGDHGGHPGASAGADLEGQETNTVDGWVVPGFVDTHVHGGGGADYASIDPAPALAARAYHRAHGTTTSFASLVTADVPTLRAQIATLVPLVGSGEFAGIHLEGPFLSPARRGAHEPSLLRVPEPRLVEELLEAGQGTIAMITLAPELPGGLAAVKRIVGAGVTAAVGHTDADEVTIAAALDAGATVATHLFNAMRPLRHREPGPVPLLLTDERSIVELICDGFHLHSQVVAMAVAAAGVNRVALVTDAMVAAGSPDGDYRLGSLQVNVSDGQARLLEPDGTLGSIAGSTLTMADAFAFAVGCGSGIPDVARMAASTPARAHGLDPVGEIRVGARADLCVVGDRGVLRRVMSAGRWL